MHIPFLKGLVGYQQPPSLGVQCIHTAFGEDMGVWILSVPVLLPTTYKCICCTSTEVRHTSEVLVHACCTLKCHPTWWSAVVQGSLWGGCCARTGCSCDVSSVKQGLTAAASITGFLPCPLLPSIFMFSLDFSSISFLLCFKILFVSHWLLFNPSKGWLPFQHDQFGVNILSYILFTYTVYTHLGDAVQAVR